jgi:hypothetical protein
MRARDSSFFQIFRPVSSAFGVRVTFLDSGHPALRPFAERRPARNSAIPGLKQSRLSPTPVCAARRQRRDPGARSRATARSRWIPAFAGMTDRRWRREFEAISFDVAVALASAVALAFASAPAVAPALALQSRMKRRRAGGSARRVAHRMCASFSPVHGCTVEKPRRPDANPRAARALHPGRLSLGYLSLAKQRKVTRTPKADETGRETHKQQQTPSSHRDRSPRIEIADARPNPRGRAFRCTWMCECTRRQDAGEGRRSYRGRTLRMEFGESHTKPPNGDGARRPRPFALCGE